MDKRNDFVNTSNLIFTDTITREDLCRVDFDIKKQVPNLENSISVYDFMKSFNDEYMRFKKDYEELGKIKLGKYNSIILDYKNSDSTLKNVEIYVEKPIMTDHNFTYFNILEKDGKIETFVTSGGLPYNNENFYRDEVKVDGFPAKDYLDLFMEYQEFVEKYKYLKNVQLFGDGTFCIFSSIDNINANLLNNLKEWKFSLGGSYFDGEDYLEFNSLFKNNFKLNEDKCRFIYDCNDELNTNYEEMAKKLYLNNKYTKRKH